MSHLKNDMQSIQSLLDDFKTVMEDLKNDISEDIVSCSSEMNGKHKETRSRRDSIADLAVIHCIQLQKLWSHVDGSQRYFQQTWVDT